MISLQDGRKELFQWDTNRYIVLDNQIGDVAEIHFANGVFNRSIDIKVEEGKALIPDVLLQYARPLRVWVFVGEPSDGYTKVEHVFKVNDRNKPSDYVFTPTEQLSLQELIEKFEDFKDSIGNEVEEYLKENPVDIVEKDPTVPQWAKLPNKPTYTAAEVGARSDRWLPTLEEIGAQPKGDYALKSEIPAISDAPVKSVNGKTGKVKLTAKDVGALEENVDLVTPEEVEDAIDKYMQEHPAIAEETDPTVPGWAKQSEKPKYTPEEIGAQPKGDYALKGEIPAVLVKSVNGKTGAVQLSAADVGALSKDTPIPAPYTLPTASADTKGGVKVGKGLQMDGDVLEAEVQKEDVDKLSEEIAGLKGESVEQAVNVPLYLEGQYINYGGILCPSLGFNSYGPIKLYAGDTVRFTAQGFDVVPAILAYTDDTFATYTPVIISEDSTVREFEYTVVVGGNYIISTDKKTPVTVCYVRTKADLKGDLDRLNTRIGIVETEISKNDVFAFVKVGVIGDSLASGASNYAGGTEDRPAYSWGKYIEREHGIPVTLFSKGGASTRSWLSSDWGKAAMESAEPCDCYIIGLGVNDKYALGSDYLGAFADIAVGSEDGNADTFYGNYSKIIAALVAKSPRCKIFCLTMPSTQDAPASTFNVAIRDVADMYTNAHLIDLEGDDYYGGSEYTALWNVAHSTAAGYKAMADHLWKRLNAYMRDNLSEFTEIQWILEDHP